MSSQKPLRCAHLCTECVLTHTWCRPRTFTLSNCYQNITVQPGNHFFLKKQICVLVLLTSWFTSSICVSVSPKLEIHLFSSLFDSRVTITQLVQESSCQQQITLSTTRLPAYLPIAPQWWICHLVIMDSCLRMRNGCLLKIWHYFSTHSTPACSVTLWR